jgi:diguanylate cyclase (GGDEF)-like protein
VAIVGGALVLPLWGAALLATAVHLGTGSLRREGVWRRWRIPVATAVAAVAAVAAVRLVDGLVARGDGRVALSGLAAAVAAVAVRRVLAARSRDGLEGDVIWAALGVVIGALYHSNPLLIPFAALPPLLISRSLSIPRLQEEARLDAKTGLYNARHFSSVLDRELGRARRFRRPTSLIMADLDLLRNTNNTYGHLAGDAVLRGIADIFRAQLRTYDIPARFGGEEFSILLPETSPEQALEIAERIRRAVAVRSFRSETSSQPLRATISMGVASYPRDADDVTQLIHQADLAVYRAKLDGRNRVVDAASTD